MKLGCHLIKPDDLHWRPSNLMRIPNADYLERNRQRESRHAALTVTAAPAAFLKDLLQKKMLAGADAKMSLLRWQRRRSPARKHLRPSGLGRPPSGSE